MCVPDVYKLMVFIHKSLLLATYCVPDLEFDLLPINGDHTCAKLYTCQENKQSDQRALLFSLSYEKRHPEFPSVKTVSPIMIHYDTVNSFNVWMIANNLHRNP